MPPDEFWFKRFAAKKYRSSDVIRLVESLHADSKHDHVVAVMLAAMANGQSQAWMYDVLPLSMKLAGRSEKEIERALLSRVDFTTTDVSSLLYSAAVLTRLDGRKLALGLYRQAAKLDPTRPEPYVMGLKLAREQHDIDAIEWACSGILAHVWTKDFKARHQLAEDAAEEATQELIKSGQKERLARFRAAIADARRRDLRVRIEWSGTGDLELSVKEPLGTMCSVAVPKTASGGLHIHDGFGPTPENCYEEYVCVQAASGEYQLQIDFLAGRIVGKRCLVTITSHGGTRLEKTSRQAVQLDGPNVKVKFRLENGRRKHLGPVPKQTSEPRGATQTTRQELIARVRRVGGGPPAEENAVRDDAGQGGVRQTSFGVPTGAFTAGVGFQPVIGLIGEGVSLTANAVVSADRRFVRISVAPFFNTLREIQTFSFQGGTPAQQGTGQ